MDVYKQTMYCTYTEPVFVCSLCVVSLLTVCVIFLRQHTAREQVLQRRVCVCVSVCLCSCTTTQLLQSQQPAERQLLQTLKNKDLASVFMDRQI